jgi:hypothetical protein
MATIIAALLLLLASAVSAFTSHLQPRITDRVEKDIRIILFGHESLHLASNYTTPSSSSRPYNSPIVDPLPSGIIHPSFYPLLLPAVLYFILSMHTYPPPVGPLRRLRRPGMRVVDRRPPRPILVRAFFM